MIKIGRIMMGVCQTNCYFLYEEGTKEVIFVDPADHGEVIFEKLKAAGFSVAGILLTHGHFDHIWGLNKLKELTGAKVYAYEGEKQLLNDRVLNLTEQCGRACEIDADVYLKDGDSVTIAGMEAKVIATPGHTQGSCCYYFEQDKILIAGDTLFEESTGRTDFATGSASEIVRSIREKLFVLSDDVAVYPGHGAQTTIGHEKKYNPFVS
jgi:glyoxylase-like metal-dependent hydrolase (beta-lactamase superfamily II)